MFNKMAGYQREVKVETTKVTWPSKDELANSTKVVIVVSLLFAIFIFGVDRVLNQVIGLVLKLR